MAKNQREEGELPHGHRDRGLPNNPPGKRPSTQPTPTSSHDPEAAKYEAEKTFEPDRDGSGS